MSFEDIGKSANVTGGMFDQVTKAALDMAVLFGGDATGYAVQLGKALSDPEKGLTALKKTGALLPADIKRIGDEFARTGDKGKAMADVIASVNRQVEEQSAAVAKTSEKIKVSLGQVIENFAKPFSEGFNALPAALESVFPAMSAKATELGSIVGTSIAMAISGDASKLVEVGTAIGGLLGDGIAIGLNLARGKIGLAISDIVPVTDLVKGIIALKTGKSKEQINQAISANMDKKAGTEISAAIQSFNDRVQNIRAGTTVITGPTGDRFRPAFAGEQSIYQDSSGNKIVPLLEKIVTNTTANPFPSK